MVAFLGSVSAGTAAATSDDLFFSELPIVASVSRLPQRLSDASASVTVIDRDMIKASGARDLNDIFRLVPGFQTYPNNTDAARVTYHGLTDEDFSPRVQVLIDGRSQYSPLFRNGVNWATLPVALEDIERVEVVRGSNAVSYGSNAFLGVINIITVDPALAHGVSVGVNRGNQGVRDTTLRAGGRLGEAGDFRFTYQAKDDDGLEDQFDWQDSLRSRMFNLRTDFWLSQRDQLQFSIGHVEARTTLGRLAKSGDVLTGGFAPGNPIRDFDQSDSYLQLQWYRALDDSSDFRLRYAYTEDRGSEQHIERRSRRGVSWAGETNLLYELDAFGDVGTRHEVEGQHAFSPLQAVRMVWGAGYRLDSLRSETYLRDQGTVYRRVGRVFGNLEWKPVEWFTGNLGAASEYDSLAGRNFAPRASTSFHLSPEHTIRVGGSRAYRTGSIVDYRGDRQAVPFATASGVPVPAGLFHQREYYGDSNAEQEKITTVELGYLGEFKSLRSSLDVRFFRERIPNRKYDVKHRLTDPALCDSPPTSGCTEPYRTSSIQDVKIRGVEYQWR
ncbi:MAG: TonB-dependent receptor, partial [Betaproteobacteria bacterium HGW-Betaproteobacteria-19]